MKYVEKLCLEIDLNFYYDFGTLLIMKQHMKGDRLYKIQSLVTYLVTQFKIDNIPGNIIAVDETMVPFRGRLKFRQYIPGKRFLGETVVLNLCEDYLDHGRTIVTDK